MTNTTPDPSQSFDEVLEKAVLSVIQDWNESVMFGKKEADAIQQIGQKAKQAITQAVKHLVEGIIGEDDELPDVGSVAKPLAKNNLRAEQRAALLKALGDEK